MTGGLVIRDAARDDVPALAALEATLFGVDAWSAAQLIDELTGPSRRGWVAVDAGGSVCGYAVTLLADDVVDLQRIAVAATAQRGGVARALLETALAAARHDGADRMLLEVSAANAPALRLYATAGFTEIDRRRRYYKDGSDAIVMRRSLARACNWESA